MRFGEVKPELDWVFPCIGDGLGDCVGAGVRERDGCIEEQVREQTVHVGAMHLVHITTRPAPERTADDNALWHDEQESLDPIVKVMWPPSSASDVFNEAVSAFPVIVAASI